MGLDTRYRIYRVLCWVTSIIGVVIFVAVVIFMFAPMDSQLANSSRDVLTGWASWLACAGTVLMIGAVWYAPNKEQRKTIRVRACFTRQAVQFLDSINTTYTYPAEWWPGQTLEDLLRLPTGYVISERGCAKWVTERRSGSLLAKFVLKKGRWDLELVS